MKKSLAYIFFATFLCVVIPSCKLVTIGESSFSVRSHSDSDTTVTYQVSDFHSIKCGGTCSIVYSIDSATNCTGTFPADLAQYIDVICDEGELEISINVPRKMRNENISFMLSSSTLCNVDVSGAAEIYFEGPVESDTLEIDGSGALYMKAGTLLADKLSISVSGAAQVTIGDMDCKTLEVDVSGAGNLDMEGKAGTADIEISGAGNVDIRRLACERVNAKTSGVGVVRRK